ncbi:hypothetical protein [Georgenia subflava]|uniref:Uncharacterized protein n=1 Tax=Georgenia subflava TaxID=1622177 RepID=A0A6N7EL22_9MICO|nr:hypothetical protein [Georgenia subflava]MPV38141.1 hypothetical protein [Georgenia subflava]
MTRRIIAVALVVLGLIAILAAIASATLWRPTDTATLTTPRPEAAVLVSDPGVLDAVADEVTITATADDDQPVTLVVARTQDVEAWLGSDPHSRITGLASWDELEVTDVEAEPTEPPTGEATGEPADEATAESTATTEPADEAPAALPNPAGSDLWVVEQTGTGNAEIEWEGADGRWSLLAATDGTTPAPTVSLTWPVDVRTPWLVPGLIVGAVLLLAGLALLALEVLTERETRRRQVVAAERARRRADGDAEETTVLPALGADAPSGTGRLTRRELREREKAAARTRGRRGAVTGEIPVVAEDENGDVRAAGAARGAGIVPGSPRASELRVGRDVPVPAPADDATRRPEPAFLPGDAGGGTPAAATTVPGGTEDGSGADEPTGAGAGTAGDADREAAGVTRGAGIVPASIRASEYRTAREPVEVGAEGPRGEDIATTGADGPAGRRTPEEDAQWVADADGLEEEPAADGTDETVQTEDEKEAPNWRSMWGFGDRDRSADESEEPR